MEHRVLIRRPEVEARTSLSRSHLYFLMSTGEFPQSVRIGRSVAWVAEEVDAWVEARIAERDGVRGRATSRSDQRRADS